MTAVNTVQVLRIRLERAFKSGDGRWHKEVREQLELAEDALRAQRVTK